MNACVIGIDVGGTKIAGGLVGFPEGTLTHREAMPTRPERGPDAVLVDVADLAARLRRHAVNAGNRAEGLGLGVPELVDLQGRVASGHTIDWRGVDLAERLAEFAPVCVEADVRAAARAEARFGAGRPYRQFVYVTVGTGISSTLVLDGVPFAGSRGNALVLASGPWITECGQCGGTVRVVVEEVSSGPALVSACQRLRPGWAGRTEDVLAAAANGDEDAVKAVRAGGFALGNSVAFLVNVLDPEAIVVGGGLGVAGGVYWDAFVETVRQLVWSDAGRDLPIVQAALGVDAGVIGAADAARER